LVAAAEAFAAGYGGIAAVAAATGMAPSTIGRGLKELAQDEPSERIRRPGAGRKPTISKDPTLLSDLETLVEPTTRGDPESPLRWTCRSVRRLVAELLNAAGYSLQGNRKTKEGDSHPIGMGNSPTSTPKWPRPISNAPSFTASGTTPSRRTPIPQIARLFADGPLGRCAASQAPQSVSQNRPRRAPTTRAKALRS
jgi:hypothetical protein